jgi:serine/threonine protein kinase
MTGRIAANTVVSGRYLILRTLGQGGFGAVYLVQDKRLGDKLCAMKEMSTATLTNPAQKQAAARAFKQEAYMLGALSHPNIPRVSDHFSEGDKQFLVIDYVEGQTLEELLLSRTQPFPENQVLAWAAQVCDALAYLHARTPPIIFRDLKPGNLMVSSNGQTIKLIDFGIVRLFKPGAGKDTTALGTPGYASPEQYGKGQSDARSDVYALGATLHHLLTLRDPSAAPFNFPPVRTLNPSVSPHVEMAIQRALEKDPAQRWASMREMRDALGVAVEITPYAPLPIAPPGTPAPPPPRVHAPTIAAPLSATPLVPPARPAYPSPVPVSPAPLGHVYPYADNSPRFAAYLVDSFLSVLLGVGVSIPVAIAMVAMGAYEEEATIVAVIAAFLGIFAYYTVPHAKSGQTPGKKMMKIKVVRRDGSPVSFGRALWRVIAYLIIPSGLTLICGGIPIGTLLFLWPFFDKENRAFHDLLADTWVIKV